MSLPAARSAGPTYTRLVVGRCAPFPLAIGLVPEPLWVLWDAVDLTVVGGPDVASLAATSVTPSGSPATASSSPGVDAESPLNTGPGIAIAAMLIGLMIWLRSRASRR